MNSSELRNLAEDALQRAVNSLNSGDTATGQAYATLAQAAATLGLLRKG